MDKRIKRNYQLVWDYLHKQDKIVSKYLDNRLKFHVKKSENTIKIYLVREEIYDVLRDHFKYHPDYISHFLNMFEKAYLKLNKKEWIESGIYSFRMDNDEKHKQIGTYKYFYQMNIDHYDSLEHLNIINMKIDTKDYSLVADHPEESPLDELKLDKYIKMVKQMNNYTREMFINFLISVVNLKF